MRAQVSKRQPRIVTLVIRAGFINHSTTVGRPKGHAVIINSVSCRVVQIIMSYKAASNNDTTRWQFMPPCPPKRRADSLISPAARRPLPSETPVPVNNHPPAHYP